ncbi:MAG: vitamin K epoxide reductase family protein [Candidatus Nanopelagicales bacterium]|nr:vitamin K epoxide reductase family protein [Candidatus Nanopelagicales bacterium]
MSTEALVESAEFTPIAKKARHIGAFSEMLVSSLLSLIASLVLSAEAITLAANPNAVFSCDISAKISCSVVGASWQASLLGFPNAFLGLIAEPVVITIALASLAGVVFPRWFMNAAWVVYTAGLVFAYWLLYEAYFNIGALCPWCLLVTVTTTMVFASMTRVNIYRNTFGFSDAMHQRLTRWLDAWIDQYIVVVIFVVIGAMIVVRYL